VPVPFRGVLDEQASDDLTAAQQETVARWQSAILRIAGEEMMHLALVQNLLSAVGAAPHLVRPNLPAPAGHYPAGVRLALLPFGEDALRHFMYLERPEGMDLGDAEGLAAMGRAAPKMEPGEIVPRLQDFATVGHLYRSIEAGVRHLADKHGESTLFIGPPKAQATTAHFSWPQLIPVTDVRSAVQAIETIVEQGEGPRSHWRDADAGFNPARPVMAANVRLPEHEDAVPLIEDHLTACCADLFNVAYEVLLQLLHRYFAHTEESDAELGTLADVAVGLMIDVIGPLGRLVTTLPVGPSHPGRTTGPSFELFYESDYLLPHRRAAWTLIRERLQEAVLFCARIHGDTRVNESIAAVGAALNRFANRLVLEDGTP
jgi:Ferritin-like